MMKLRSSPASPFGRKVKLALAILGLKGRVEVEDANTADPSDSLRSQNPLGKIPALILENGDVLYDSAVILEYLDFVAGGGKLFPEGEARFAVLRDQTLADGVMDAAILRIYEKRFKEPKYRDPAWDAYQAAKMERGLAYFEANVPAAPGTAADIDAGTLTLACALGYLDLRFGDSNWRADHPKLAAWLDAFEAAVPAYADTRQPPAPVPDNAPAVLK
ncbi:glutathione S-transferase family protein [Roseibium sp. Sym1]|uniref:glutathione S-transferase family protein n=1 Tax=Roseibium sp. Sym1 TaxID=3016006 RepID=UPI0022B2E7B9|nr:glutathione S-transferase family protein [Roseibium sp. Sym1]